jgi:hypothetical protein
LEKPGNAGILQQANLSIMSQLPALSPFDRLVAIAKGEGVVPSRIPGRPPVEAAAVGGRFEEAAAAILFDMRVLAMPEARALIGVSRYEFEAEILPRYGVSTTVPSDEAAGAGMPVKLPA